MIPPWTYSPVTGRPSSRWPGGARVALWVAVGVEAYRPDGGQTEDILPGNPAPDLVNIAWRDYGNRVGAFRLFDRLAGLGIRPTVLLNTDVYDEAPEVVAAARSVGAEIVAHGHSNSDSLPEISSEAEQDYIGSCRSRIAHEEERAPGGWSSPWLAHRETTLATLRRNGFDYVLDFRLDDQPIWIGTEAGPILSIPYAAELNDSTTLIGRNADATDFAQMILDEFDELADSPGDHSVVMSVVLHSFISGRPFRMKPIARALAQIARRQSEVWLATPRTIWEEVCKDPSKAAGQHSDGPL